MKLLESDIAAFLRRTFVFAVVFVTAYLLAVCAIANTDSARLHRVTHVPDPFRIAKRSSRLRLNEVRLYENLDILFIGSSHAYRTFDPRFFNNMGLRTFNLGSTAQTPLNTYYLLKIYAKSLNPRLVVFEVFPRTFAGGAAESTVDLVPNLPLSADLIRMVIATRNRLAVNTLLARVLNLRPRRLDQVKVRLPRADTYVGQGYVEKAADYKRDRVVEPHRVKIRDYQLEYLERSIELMRTLNAKVVLVVQPLPRATLENTIDYDAISLRLAHFARENGVEYVDFNHLMQLDTRNYFYDWHHLNQAGVEMFLPRFCLKLKAIGAFSSIPETRRNISCMITNP